jgi:hypothetical protein
MNMKIYFPGGKKVYADYLGFTYETDQPVKAGGEVIYYLSTLLRLIISISFFLYSSKWESLVYT